MIALQLIHHDCCAHTYLLDSNAESLPYFSGFLAVWATLLLEFWKRTEAWHTMKWGTSDFKAQESVRYEYEGELVESPIDGSTVRFFPR